jgi:uncharacterized membrane protein (DUF2068 family)
VPSNIHHYDGVHREPGRLGRHARVDRETFVCAVRGHVTPAEDVARLRPEDSGLGIDVDARRFVRCVRCDAWLETTPPSVPKADTLLSLSELELPRRGRDLRGAIVLRLIALDRGVHCLIFGALAWLFLYLGTNLHPLKTDAARLLRAINDIASNSGQGNSHNFLSNELTKFLHSQRSTFLVLGIMAVAYAVVEGAEAVGLWLEKRWAEYLTAVATAGFLPFEIHELIARVTVLRVVAFVVNVAILVYLLWAKRLFGIRGGAKAEEHEVDRDALFGPASGAVQNATAAEA